MKKVKKIMALMLAMVMVLSMAIPAMAQTVGTAAEGKGSITIENAAKGETYGLVKLFDATLTKDSTATTDASGIAYTGTIPDDLKSIFEKDEAGNTHVKDGVTDQQVTDAVTTWAKKQTASPTAVSDGSALTFEGLDYGYYAVITSQGATVTIDSTKPTATVVDKNKKVPSATKEVDPAKGSIGDTVTYTATFNAPNYLQNEDTGKSEQVVSYIIEDTLPTFLSDVAITSVKVIETPAQEAQGEEGEDGYVPATEEVSTDLSSSYKAFTNKKIEIPWVVENVPTADHKYTSKYKNGSQIVITYTAKITSEAAIGAGNVNKVSLKPQVDRGNGKVPFSETDKWNDEATIYTHAAALQKKALSETGDNLAGAEFSFKGLIVTGKPGMYTVVSYNPSSTANGTVMKCDANGKLVIAGINADSDNPIKLIGTETKAPDGFNKLPGTFELTTIVMSTETTTTHGSQTTYYDADGNIVDVETEGGTSITRNDITAISEIPAASIQPVVNNKGSELPSTGGIGTTMFYVIGAVLVIGAGVILISRRRMNMQ